MSAALKLIIFDVDGTLVDSQGAILGAMRAGFASLGMTAPCRVDILGIVGLSLDHAMLRLSPDCEPQRRGELVEAYKHAYHQQRLVEGAENGSPLYPGARDIIENLNALPDTVLGVATGKSRRGLDALLVAHGLEKVFVTTQVADDHPSKPHPSMIATALAETGVEPGHAVMIGDTSFDLDMAIAAGIPGIGVSWGYHPVDQLHRRAACVIDDFAALPPALETLWNTTT